MLDHISKEEVGSKWPSGSILYRNESQFQRLLEKLPAGAYTCDPRGLITYFNQHALQIWGRAPKLNDPVDRFCGSFKLFSVTGEPIAHSQCWMALALRMNREYNGHEILIERPDGTRITALAHANPIHDESGVLLGAVNVLVDISDRKKSEQALKDADRSKNEFMARLVHALRNPLTPIRNAVEILHLEGAPSPELQWAVDVIDRQTHQMARIIEDLLDLARVTGNKLELQKERIDMEEIVRAAVEINRPLIDLHNHDLMMDLTAQPLIVEGDRTRLTQVLSNLLSNAARYTPNGGRIWLRMKRQGEDALVAVRDTGIGLSAEMLPRIFDTFAQIGQARDQSQSGLGIGLTLARWLVNLHGGTLTARSDGPDMGSEFLVTLPVMMEQTLNGTGG